MPGKWSFFVADKPWIGGRDLFMQVSDHQRNLGFVQPLIMTTVERGRYYDVPTLTETREDRADALGDVDGFLQAALDTAWGLGMRPRGFADHANELTAVRYHLEDMRALAKVPVR